MENSFPVFVEVLVSRLPLEPKCSLQHDHAWRYGWGEGGEGWGGGWGKDGMGGGEGRMGQV